MPKSKPKPVTVKKATEIAKKEVKKHDRDPKAHKNMQ